MTGLLDKLNNHGIKNISSVLNNPNKELTFQVINWIRTESGINLYEAGSDGENLKAIEMNKLKDLDLVFALKFNPQAKLNLIDSFTKFVGPFSGFLIIIFCIALDAYIIYTITRAPSTMQGIGDLNPFITLVTGYYHAKLGEILSYWYGTSQTESEKNQQNLQKL